MDEDLTRLGAGELDVVLLHDGRTLQTHGPLICQDDEHCCIHKPSDHPLRSAPMHWREAGMFDIKPSHMERICPHGQGHPDPDALAHIRRTDARLAADLAVHGCDGCCRS